MAKSESSNTPGEETLLSSILIQGIPKRNFGKFSLSFDCVDCGLHTSVTFERGTDGTLSWASPNASPRYQTLKQSLYRPCVGVTSKGNVLISCGSCRSRASEDPLPPAAGISSTLESLRCESLSPYDSTQCGLPGGHPGKHGNGLAKVTWD